MAAETADELLDQADQHFRAERLSEAAAVLVRAAELVPDDPRILRALGIALVSSHRAADALPALHRLTELRSDDPGTFHQLGDALAFAGDLPAAEAALRRSVALSPDYAPAWARLGMVLRAQGNDAGAVDAFERTARLQPHPDVLSNLADALIAMLRPDEAVEKLHDALRMNPSHVISHVNLSCAYMRLGAVDPALDEIRQALRLAPNFEPAHYYLALALLKRGELAEGFKELEWRFRRAGNDSAKTIDQSRRRWRGEDLTDQTILLHAEQGFGDAIQFARYIAPVLERATRDGGKVIVACHHSLWRLFQRSFPGIAELIDPPATPTALPAGVDFQCPFMSLAAIFQTISLDAISAAVPYLTPPVERVAHWKAKLPPIGTKRKVGVIWHGKPINSLDRYRSCRLSDLEPLLSLPGVAFFSLQKDDPPGDAPRMINHTAELHDWADTAALMTNLDLIVSVDSAPLHLAGALGLPTWAILSRGADWRWHVDREDSPWYPTMRLFRQTTVGKWDDVFKRVALELAKKAANAGV